MEKMDLTNIAAERAVLAGICQHGHDAMIDVMDIISLESFTKQNTQAIYKCLQTAFEQTTFIDIPTIYAAASELKLHDMLMDAKEAEFVRSIFNFPIELENVRTYAVVLRKLQIARELKAITKNIHDSLNTVTGKESIDEIFSKVEEPVLNYSIHLGTKSDNAPIKIGQGIEEYLEYLMDNQVDMLGISTGFKTYDEVIGGGLRRKSVNLIGARPKTGKTSIAKEIAIHIAQKLGIPVLMLDTEMAQNDQIHRSLASKSKVSVRDIETGKFANNLIDKNAVLKAAKEMKEIPYFYKNIAGKPFSEILSIIRRWIMKEVGYDDNGVVKDAVVIYDYFKLMDSSDLDNMQEYQALGFQISKLTDFTNQNDIACLSFVQINRDGIGKEDGSVISQSDRLLWLCGSFCILKRKTAEEIAEDGIANGNMKLIPIETRYGAGMSFGDYINLKMDGSIAHLEEVSTRGAAQTASLQEKSGFDMSGVDDDSIPFE